MGNKTIKLFIISIVTILFSLSITSCNRPVGGEHHGTDTDNFNIRLEINGKVIHRYSPSGWQLSYSDVDKRFTVLQDDGLQYYAIVCNQMPDKEGKNLTGQLKWTQNGKVNSGEYDFEVLQINSDGLITLYNPEAKITVVVKQLN